MKPMSSRSRVCRRTTSRAIKMDRKGEINQYVLRGLVRIEYIPRLDVLNLDRGHALACGVKRVRDPVVVR